jgi:hypothetical protein
MKRLILLAAMLLGVSAAAQFNSVRAASSGKRAHLVLDHGTTKITNAATPCTGSTCGLTLSWKKAVCDTNNQDRYPPIVLTWTDGGKLATNAWPLVIPCSQGITLNWNKKGQIIEAQWVKSTVKPTADGLAVCFTAKSTCSAVDCVTEGCIPAHTNGFDIFFQGKSSLRAASWLKGGSVVKKVKFQQAPTHVFWYGHKAPANPFGASVRRSGANPDSIETLVGRNAASTEPVTDADTAPAKANGFEVAWFLPSDQQSPTRGCFTAAGKTWATFPRAIAYTTNGALNSPITVPVCVTDSNGNNHTYNTAEFDWQLSSDGSKDVLTAATASDNLSANKGCKASKSSGVSAVARAGAAPVVSLPQPPAGTDGVTLGFPHNDFKAACWVKDGSVLGSAMPSPTGVRLSRWAGKTP